MNRQPLQCSASICINFIYRSHLRSNVHLAGAGAICARYCQIGAEIPVFGGRDKAIRYSIKHLSAERRNGYSWFGAELQRALDRYEKWVHEHPEFK